jgi:hypothetical protein
MAEIRRLDNPRFSADRRYQYLKLFRPFDHPPSQCVKDE